MKYNPNSVYKRIDNVLYQDDVAIYNLHSTFPDWNPLTEQGAKYMERFIEMNPTWVEMIAVNCIVIDDPKVEIAVDEKAYTTFIAADLKQSPPNVVGQIFTNKSYEGMSDTTIVRKDIEGNFHLKENCERVEKQITRDIESTTTFGVESHDPNSSRLDQVRYWMSRGATSPSIIASTIRANASYVQRLVSQIKQES